MLRKKTTVWLLAIGLVGAITLASNLAYSANGGGIKGSIHDFSNNGWNPTGELCVVCHTPHGANKDPRIGGGAPLWNRQVTQSTFIMYSSPTFASRGGTTIGAQPDGVSLLCLSCHDGTIGLDQFKPPNGWENPNVSRDDWTLAKFTNANNASAAWGHNNTLIGTDLKNDHPISFMFDENLANLDHEIYVPDGGPNYITGYNGLKLPLFNGKLQCATCHSVHNKGDTAANTGYLLRIGNSNNTGERASGLCLSCHNK